MSLWETTSFSEQRYWALLSTRLAVCASSPVLVNRSVVLAANSRTRTSDSPTANGAVSNATGSRRNSAPGSAWTHPKTSLSGGAVN